MRIAIQNRNLNMAWNDSHKAFDSSSHSWRLKVLHLLKAFDSVPHSQILEISPVLIILLRINMSMQQITLDLIPRMVMLNQYQ